MNSTTSSRETLRELTRLHFVSLVWLPVMCAVVAACALAVLLGEIMFGQFRIGTVAPPFRAVLEYSTVICWGVSIVCAYAAGFVMGRL